jgi:hypothetical protein
LRDSTTGTAAGDNRAPREAEIARHFYRGSVAMTDPLFLFTEEALALLLTIVMVGGLVGFVVTTIVSLFTKED